LIQSYLSISLSDQIAHEEVLRESDRFLSLTLVLILVFGIVVAKDGNGVEEDDDEKDDEEDAEEEEDDDDEEEATCSF